MSHKTRNQLRRELNVAEDHLFPKANQHGIRRRTCRAAVAVSTTVGVIIVVVVAMEEDGLVNGHDGWR